MHGNLDIVNILAPLSTTPNILVNEIDTLWTPIYHATLCHDIEIVKFLCSLTKTPNAAEFNQLTPLHIASLFGYVDIVDVTHFFFLPLRGKDLPNG